MLPWWDTFGGGGGSGSGGGGGGRTLRALAFYEGQRLVGLAPLLARPFVHPPHLRFRRLELLASGEDEADEICSEHLGFVVAPGAEEAVIAAFASALRDGRFGPWDELVLPSLDEEGPLVARLQAELTRQRLLVTLEERAIAPFIPLPPTWEEYLAALDPGRRARLQGWLAALERLGPPVLTRARTPADVESARRLLERLHRAHHPDGGVYASARFRSFHERVAPGLLELGALEVGSLAVGGEPLAAFYNLRWSGRVSHYESGHAPDAPPEVHLGVTLQALLVRAAIGDGLREYDFLAGAQDYKTALSLRQRRLLTMRVARPSLVESARTVAGLLRRVGKDMRHRIRP